MKYSKFLLVFVAPIALVSGILALPRMNKREWFAVLMLPALAAAWTTPWDNYLVAKGVWSYDRKKVWGVILGYVPLEEYVFFVLQTLAVAFPSILILRKMGADAITRSRTLVTKDERRRMKGGAPLVVRPSSSVFRQENPRQGRVEP